MQRIRFYTVLALVAMLGMASVSQPTAAEETPQQRDARMAWWRDARFGLFVHWGLYALPAGQWKGLEKDQDLFAEWIMYKAKIPVVEYELLAKQFNPVKFDAEQWVKLAKQAGMKYIVITAKHCDGFAMYPSQASKYNIMDATPFGRDPLAELKKACDAQGLRLGFYYSHCWDWHEPDALGQDNTWDFPDRAKKDSDKYVREKALPQVEELLARYQPWILWFDVPTEMPEAQSRQFIDAIRRMRPECIVNDRIGNDLGDYDTPEQFIPNGAAEGDFETNMTLNDHWGYQKDDDRWKPAAEVIHQLVDVVSKGGNYLLNVGPTAEGTFPPDAVRILEEVGDWMQTNSESIYGAGLSPLGPLHWGRCTAKPGRLYLHVFDWPADGKLLVPGLKSQPKRIWLLADAERKPLTTSRPQPQDLVIDLPAAAPNSIDAVVALEIDGPPEVDSTLLLMDRAGVENRFGAFDAQRDGPALKYQKQLFQEKKYDSIGSWKHESDSLSWPFRAAAPAAWDVEIVYAATPESEGNEFIVFVGPHPLAGKAVSTGKTKTGRKQFQRFKLGSVDLPAGEHMLRVAPKTIAAGSELMDLHAVILTPATP